MVVTTALILFAGCTAGGTGITEGLILNAVKDVAPVFDTSASRATWNLGSPIYELYGVLKGDGEPVGYFNLYGLMEDADSYFSQLEGSGESISAQEVSPPPEIEFGFTSAQSQYNLYYGYEGSGSDAGKYSKTYGMVDGAKYYMLVVMQNKITGEDSRQVIQGVYDSSTGDIDIRMFYANNIESGWEKGYAFVSGNTETHQFSMKVIRDGTEYDHNIVGFGVSQGNDYFLIKLANNTMDISSAVYYEFDANSLITGGYEDDIAAITALTAASLPTDAELDALNFYTAVSHN